MQPGGFRSTGVGRFFRNNIWLAVAGVCGSQAAASVTTYCSKSASGHRELDQCWLESEKRVQMFVVLASIPQRAGGDSW